MSYIANIKRLEKNGFVLKDPLKASDFTKQKKKKKKIAFVGSLPLKTPGSVFALIPPFITYVFILDCLRIILLCFCVIHKTITII
jgi:hypothetical protein